MIDTMTLEQNLILAKLQWEQRRQAYQEALAFLNDTIQDSALAGMNQSEIGRALGWPRQRVSKLLSDLAAETPG